MAGFLFRNFRDQCFGGEQLRKLSRAKQAGNGRGTLSFTNRKTSRATESKFNNSPGVTTRTVW